MTARPIPSISILWKGLGTSERKMKSRARRVSNLRGVNGRIITDWFKVVQVNFQTGGGGHKPSKRWKALKKETRKQKQAMGRDGGILIRFGNLRQQWALTSTKAGGEMTSTASSRGKLYAGFHEKGAPGRNLPKRKILPTIAHASKIAVKHYGKHVKFSIKVP